MDNRAYATTAQPLERNAASAGDSTSERRRTTTAQPQETGEPILNTVNGVLSESIELLHTATDDVRQIADSILGPVPTPIGKDSDRVGGPSTPARGVQLESNARTVRELIFGLRNQINRLPAI